MKKLITVLGLSLVFMTSCVRETIVVNDPLITDADVYFEYTADAFGTIVEGEVYNDGETFIDAVQLQIGLYNRRGVLIDYEFVWVDTYFHPGGSVGFYFDLPYYNVYDVSVDIHRYD